MHSNRFLLLLALGDVARARGMTDVAHKAGWGRERLYKALIPGAQPRLPTVMKVLHALGLRLRVESLGESPAQSL